MAPNQKNARFLTEHAGTLPPRLERSVDEGLRMVLPLYIHSGTLPKFQLELTIFANQFEIRPVCGDQTSAVGTRCECNQNIKMEIAQLFCRESSLFIHPRQNVPGLCPNALGRHQDRERGFYLLKSRTFARFFRPAP
jgi:hypothetical protein